MGSGILTDLTKCIGCEACATACKEVNNLPKEIEPRLTARTWTTVEHRGNLHIRRQCMHCADPTCASVCPVAALEKTEAGPVVYYEDKCIGCRYCIMACPFGMPKYEWETTSPLVRKCSMCAPRLAEGKQPGCTSVCPTGATIFGPLAELVQTAKQRIKDNPGRYVDHIYGLEEAGGTAVLYLSDLPFAQIGFAKARTDTTYPQLTWAVLSQVPTIASVGGVTLCGVAWIIHRRMALAKLRAEEEAAKKEGK